MSVFTFIQLLEGKNGLTPVVGKRRWSFHHTQRRAPFVVARLWSVRVRSVYYKRPFLTLQFSSVKMGLCVPPYLAKEIWQEAFFSAPRSILLLFLSLSPTPPPNLPPSSSSSSVFFFLVFISLFFSFRMLLTACNRRVRAGL